MLNEAFRDVLKLPRFGPGASHGCYTRLKCTLSSRIAIGCRRFQRAGSASTRTAGPHNRWLAPETLTKDFAAVPLGWRCILFDVGFNNANNWI